MTDHGSTISGTQTPFQLDETLVCHHASSCCVQKVVVLDRIVNLLWSKGNAGRKPFLNHARSVSSIVHSIDLRVNDPHVGRVSQPHVVGSTLLHTGKQYVDHGRRQARQARSLCASIGYGSRLGTIQQNGILSHHRRCTVGSTLESVCYTPPHSK